MTSRREFLTGRPFRDEGDDNVEPVVADLALLPANTIRLACTAMASDFEVILNPGSGGRLEGASAALHEVDRLEDQLSVYRPMSELSRLNARGATEEVVVESRLFELIERALQLAGETEGAFDPTAGRMVTLWRTCRRDRRLPTESELEAARRSVGSCHVQLDLQRKSVRFDSPGIELNFNAMGKGYALDRAGELLEQWFENELRRQSESGPGEPPIPRSAANSWLMHGGYSSLLARGSLAGVDGWPVAIRHPLLPGRTLATVWLKDRGLSTSGAGVQFFRHQGKRYGHIVDPRTGWPAEGMLSATVLAPDAATAEALSTAFFVLGVETARSYCHNHTEVAALLVPAPASGGRVEPIVCGLSDSELMFPLDH